MKSPVISIRTYQLCCFVRASLTKAQRLGGLDNRDTCSQSYNKKSQNVAKVLDRCVSRLISPPWGFFSDLWMVVFSLCFLIDFPLCACVSISVSSYTDTSDCGWEPTLTSSLNLPFDQSYSKYGSVYRFWMSFDPLQWLSRRITSDLD